MKLNFTAILLLPFASIYAQGKKKKKKKESPSKPSKVSFLYDDAGAKKRKRKSIPLFLLTRFFFQLYHHQVARQEYLPAQIPRYLPLPIHNRLAPPWYHRAHRPQFLQHRPAWTSQPVQD
ncbi:hypothetical protein DM01DRAFT_1017571 [Hesseltinella vesiculosa]|uniref:Uncharacterized protein n=1 Tax=Hesseltinella vesiculosa TaxID=101127 RepID=A0A1X2GKW4_9FUNG|nr:hypothetical protein DM01DRAFT_1017571 [Hesseltinella vesiculosa]